VLIRDIDGADISYPTLRYYHVRVHLRSAIYARGWRFSDVLYPDLNLSVRILIA
jgi:hypothetical protein